MFGESSRWAFLSTMYTDIGGDDFVILNLWQSAKWISNGWFIFRLRIWGDEGMVRLTENKTWAVF